MNGGERDALSGLACRREREDHPIRARDHGTRLFLEREKKNLNT
jgi:hypothetical protein